MMCSHENAWHTRTIYENGALHTVCDRCGLEGAGEGIPDAYLGHIGQTFAALCDNMGRPIEIRSKRHKQQVMDKLGVRECPDRLSGKTWVDGTREYRREQFNRDRPVIRETLRRWKERA